MKITTKGQVTIPAKIRKKAGFLPHTNVEFAIEGKTVCIKKSGVDRSRGEKLVAAMRGKGNVKMTTDEIMKLTRG